MEEVNNWHDDHLDSRSLGDRAADKVANYMGSWKFILLMTAVILLWVTLNVCVIAFQWDPYPFILLNLFFSTQASYAAPFILMSQNRAGERDRVNAQHDYEVNKEALEHLRILRSQNGGV